jgi:hypothetical protein
MLRGLSNATNAPDENTSARSRASTFVPAGSLYPLTLVQRIDLASSGNAARISSTNAAATGSSALPWQTNTMTGSSAEPGRR